MENNNDFKYTEAYKKAQVYELRCNNHFADNDTSYRELSKDILIRAKNYKEKGELKMFDSIGSLCDTKPNSGWLKEFFNSNVDDFLKFNDKIKEKNNLEIGSGPCGFLNHMYWLKNRNIVEPLLDGYREKQISLLGESWFNKDVNCYSQPAEILIPELVGKIDGMIVCRNCIDHTQDWKSIMNNIGQYASTGSTFLFWADLYHLTGGDDGHFNVTKDKIIFRNYVKELGFEIKTEWEMPEAERKCINIGFTAIKNKT